MSASDHPHRADALRARSWLLHHAIPYWSSHGFDRAGFAYEESDFTGAMRETGYRRTMVQFRQTYVFAYAALLGACDPSLSRRLFARTVTAAWHPDGGWVHRLDAAGNVLDPTRDAYDQAFALLASAWVYRLDRDPATLAWAYRTLAFMDAQLRSPFGGYEEAIPARTPRRQNPHMHLYEALLCLYEVSQDDSFLERARGLAQLLGSHFVSQSGALREYFGPLLEPLAGVDGECVEPGHHAEWTWLLHEHARLDVADGAAHSLRARALFGFVERHGFTPSGLPAERVDTHGAITHGGTKLWAMCETLKAYVVRAEAAGERSVPAISALVDAIFERFLGHQAPVWFEGVAADGTPDTRRMPTSTLYHLTLAFSELLRFSEQTPRLLSASEAP
jgi:mannose/cellobiose epimerase-like protein (N-acyl-D-glucosamine 2-epimerase family)